MRLTKWTDYTLQVLMHCAATQRRALAPTIGDVLRETETDFNMVECFDDELNTCHLNRICKLKDVLHEATKRYLEVLDRVTIADMLPSTTRNVEHPLKRMKLKV